MKIAVSGSHSTGKSTLVAAFAAQRPHYVCEPEAFEVLADEITLMPLEGICKKRMEYARNEHITRD